MKSYNNIVELFVERNGIEQFVDENNVVWYNLDNIIEVIDTNMDWYKHLFTTKIVVLEDKEVRYITKTAFLILLQNTETLYSSYLKLLAEYDAIRIKLEDLERKLFI
jgi:hypothetical protein